MDQWLAQWSLDDYSHVDIALLPMFGRVLGLNYFTLPSHALFPER